MKKPIEGACIGFFLSAVVCGVACSRQAANPAPQAAAPAAAAPAQAAPAPPAAAPAAAAPAPAAAASVIASETYSADPGLRCDLLEVRRVSGGALRVKWRLANTSEKTMTTEGKTIYYTFDWGDLYYVDPAENKKYGFLTDTEGNRILDLYWGNFKAGEQKTQWAKFPAPPPTSSKITVHIPKFTPFEDVPVSH